MQNLTEEVFELELEESHFNDTKAVALKAPAITSRQVPEKNSKKYKEISFLHFHKKLEELEQQGSSKRDSYNRRHNIFGKLALKSTLNFYAEDFNALQNDTPVLKSSIYSIPVSKKNQDIKDFLANINQFLSQNQETFGETRFVDASLLEIEKGLMRYGYQIGYPKILFLKALFSG